MIGLVTISWIYLAYTINNKHLKLFLHLAVLVNALMLSYLVYTFAFIPQEITTSGSSYSISYGSEIVQLLDIYLWTNTAIGIIFIFLFLLFWTIGRIKLKEAPNGS